MSDNVFLYIVVKTIIHLYFCMYLFSVCLCGVYTWGIKLRLSRLGGSYVYPLSHLTSPVVINVDSNCHFLEIEVTFQLVYMNKNLSYFPRSRQKGKLDSCNWVLCFYKWGRIFYFLSEAAAKGDGRGSRSFHLQSWNRTLPWNRIFKNVKVLVLLKIISESRVLVWLPLTYCPLMVMVTSILIPK